MKIRTQAELQELLDRDFAWRLKEIAEMKDAIRPRSNAIIRAGLALLYAHWEGFVKNSSQYYLTFVACQKLKYEELKPCFVVFGLKKELNFLADSRQHQKNTKTVEFLTKEMKARANLSYKNAIDTESNLSSTVFNNIASSIGIDITPYETRFKLIDESLLERRNRIAHGDDIDVDPNEYINLSKEVILMMRSYKTDIENAMSMKSYKA